MINSTLKIKKNLQESFDYIAKGKTIKHNFNSENAVFGDYSITFFYFLCFIYSGATLYLFYRQATFDPTTGLFPSDLLPHLFSGMDGKNYSLVGSTSWLISQLFQNKAFILVNIILLVLYNAVGIMLIRKSLIEHSADKKPTYLIDIMSVFLFLSTMIFLPFEDKPYILRTSPNVYHNSTALVCRLFSILTALKFFKTFKFYELYINKKIAKNKLIFEYALLAVYTCLCMYSKPSFLSSFFPACVIVLFAKLIISKGETFWPSFWVGISFIPSMFILFFQNSVLYPDAGESFLIISPFNHIFLNHGNILSYFINMVLGIAFPLFMFVTTIRHIKFEETIYYLSYFIAQIIYIVFDEGGFRAGHGNFGWGIVLCSFFIFYVAVCRLLKNDTPILIKQIGFMLFFTHVICGFFYLSKLLLGFNFF